MTEVKNVCLYWKNLLFSHHLPEAALLGSLCREDFLPSHLYIPAQIQPACSSVAGHNIKDSVQGLRVCKLLSTLGLWALSVPHRTNPTLPQEYKWNHPKCLTPYANLSFTPCISSADNSVLLIHKNNLSEVVAIDFFWDKGQHWEPVFTFYLPSLWQLCWWSLQSSLNGKSALLPIIIVHHYLLKDFPLLLIQVESLSLSFPLSLPPLLEKQYSCQYDNLNTICYTHLSVWRDD